MKKRCLLTFVVASCIAEITFASYSPSPNPTIVVLPEDADARIIIQLPAWATVQPAPFTVLSPAVVPVKRFDKQVKKVFTKYGK